MHTENTNACARLHTHTHTLPWMLCDARCRSLPWCRSLAGLQGSVCVSSHGASPSLRNWLTCSSVITMPHAPISRTRLFSFFFFPCNISVCELSCVCVYVCVCAYLCVRAHACVCVCVWYVRTITCGASTSACWGCALAGSSCHASFRHACKGCSSCCISSYRTVALY